MGDLDPKGEDLRKAVRWIGEQRVLHPDMKLHDLLDEAAQKFDLSPADAEQLLQKLIAYKDVK